MDLVEPALLERDGADFGRVGVDFCGCQGLQVVAPEFHPCGVVAVGPEGDVGRDDAEAVAVFTAHAELGVLARLLDAHRHGLAAHPRLALDVTDERQGERAGGQAGGFDVDLVEPGLLERHGADFGRVGGHFCGCQGLQVVAPEFHPARVVAVGPEGDVGRDDAEWSPSSPRTLSLAFWPGCWMCTVTGLPPIRASPWTSRTSVRVSVPVALSSASPSASGSRASPLP